MLVLPFPPRRAQLRSFWLLACTSAIIVSGAAVTVIAGPLWGLLSVGCVAMMAVAGFGSSEIQLKAYRLWNTWAGRLQRVGYRWTLFLCHRMLAVIGPVGSRFDPASKGQSAATSWSDYSQQAAGPGPVDEIEWQNWSREYRRWAREPGNRWGLLIWPFLLILSLFRPEEANDAMPSNIYTLF